MKITLYNVCVVQWGVLSTVGDIMSTVGGYHEYRGGYLEYRGGVQYRGDIMINVRDILSTVGVFSTMGDIMMHVGEYHEYRGGGESFVILAPHGTEHPHGTHDIPHMYHDIPHGTQISKDGIPPRYS